MYFTGNFTKIFTIATLSKNCGGLLFPTTCRPNKKKLIHVLFEGCTCKKITFVHCYQKKSYLHRGAFGTLRKQLRLNIFAKGSMLYV